MFDGEEDAQHGQGNTWSVGASAGLPSYGARTLPEGVAKADSWLCCHQQWGTRAQDGIPSHSRGCMGGLGQTLLLGFFLSFCFKNTNSFIQIETRI